ncbi:Ribosome assembly protein 1 [Echinococcus granulosus]|uniref:Elongation factor Tu GTP binding n=1 Tax=Echinococcus granulosus TaxID=6210 RepID=A0A068WBA9_ECHGR|nr:Ribosome assembly protein 1 [Echinococcus granulosus]CDS17344.1 elongation factor Tu GTP binding [Echinococcus granulosus]
MTSASRVLPFLSCHVDKIRNVCILAHVDHGKTSLADALLATNGIISFRQAGELRFMDSLEAEQVRGITMKSSAVALFYNPTLKLSRHISPQAAADDPDSYLINFIDSPGHVDFASDVSTAVRLCDCAMIVVDVAEGVCPQTRAVLRQAWNERLTLILVLNKFDRLFLQLGLSPIQVYDRILRVLEQINSVLAEMFTADVMQQTHGWEADGDSVRQSAEGTYTWSTGLEATDDSHVYFSPDKANVLFTSAVDGWGFRISDFGDFWAERMNLPKKGLLKALWGDYYFTSSPDGGLPRVKPHARAKNKKPVFVQLIIDHLHHIYKTIIVDNNRDMAPHIAERLGIKLESRLHQQSVDNRTLVRSILSTWQPLGPAIFRTIVDTCPSPLAAISRERAQYMLFGESSVTQFVSGEDAVVTSDGSNAGQSILREVVYSCRNDGTEEDYEEDESAAFPAIDALEACSSNADAPVIIFVSKVFWADKLKNAFSTIVFPKNVPKSVQPPKSVQFPSAPRFATPGRIVVHHDNVETAIKNPANSPFSDTEFVALSRIYSGRVKIGQRLFVLGPKFDGSNIPKCLLDANPADLPLGPLRIPEPEEDDLTSLVQARHRSSSCSSISSNLSGAFSAGSVGDSGHHDDQVLRHVYVGEITDVVQFCGGQNNAFHLKDPSCPIDSLSAGNVVGLMGASVITSLPKSGLLVSSLRLVATSEARRVLPLAGLAIWHGAPVVSLAIEPASATDPNDMVRLENGLRLLERSDPCAELTFSPKGEYLLHAAGEIHMQKCLEDLTTYFAPDLELHTSPFLVPFRETVTEACPPASYVPFDSLAFAKAQLERELKEKHLVYDDARENCVRLCTSNEEEEAFLQQQSLQQTTCMETSDPTRYLPLGMLQLPHSKSRTRVFVRVTAHPVPENLLTWLETRAAAYMHLLMRAVKHKSSSSRRALTCLKRFEEEFSAQLDAVPPEACYFLEWHSLKGRLLCLGPQQVGPNLLLSRLRSNFFRLDTAWGKPMSPWSDAAQGPGADAVPTGEVGGGGAVHIPFLSYGKAILRGFQVATEQGPLCAEPMRGVAFVLEDIYAEDRIQLPTPRILTSADLLAKEATHEVAAELKKANEPAPEPVGEAAVESDPILAALRAKQAAIKRRQKADFISSMSWLNLRDDDNDANNDEDGEDDCLDDDGDWYNDDNDNCDQNLSEVEEEDEEANSEVEEEHAAKSEKKLTLREHFYWQRRSDNDWLSDVTPGLLTPAMARACTSAFMACPAQRLVLSMYDIELQCRGDVLGRMYAVLRKRCGRVVSEDMREGEECFVTHARLPVVESFGLTNDLRKRTSGLVSLPQLRPGGWEVLEVDPLQRDASGHIAILGETHIKVWQRQQEAIKRLRLSERNTVVTADITTSPLSGPGIAVRPASPNSSSSTSDSEVDEDLAQAESNNQLTRLRTYLRDVRKRKGLSLHEQIVTSADKQRTLKKNK